MGALSARALTIELTYRQYVLPDKIWHSVPDS